MFEYILHVKWSNHGESLSATLDLPPMCARSLAKHMYNASVCVNKHTFVNMINKKIIISRLAQLQIQQRREKNARQKFTDE
jgi:hypothetical protein